jgi:non-specific serine/threonine protein kinase
MITFKNLLSERNLKAFSGASIFARGAQYFRLARVRIKYADFQEAECIVRGSNDYTIRLWLHQGEELGAACSCPFAKNGWFCKHMVAAGLAVFNHLDLYGDELWKTRLDVLLEGIRKKNKKKSEPFWIFISFQKQPSGWKFQPYHLWINQIPKGVLPDNPLDFDTQLPELIKYNPWILEYTKPYENDYQEIECINGDQDSVAFVNLLLQQNHKIEELYHFDKQSDPYSLGLLFPILTQVNLPIYYGDYINPIRSHLRFLKESVFLSLELIDIKGQLQLQASLRDAKKCLDLSLVEVEIITHQNNPWILTDGHIFQLRSEMDIEFIYPWIKNPILTILSEQEDKFFKEYFPALVKQIPIKFQDILYKNINVEPVKRLYLSDELSNSLKRQSDGLNVCLCFGYGDHEVAFEKDSPSLTFLRDVDEQSISCINRKSLIENRIWKELSSARFGLKRSGNDFDDNVFILRAKVHPLDFLMRYVPRLAESGFEIYGEESLKSNRVNRNKPSISLSVSSDIDWFDLQVVVRFGDIRVSFSDIRHALKRKEKYVKLADGTIGVIPDKWIQRYQHLFGLGEQVDNGVRFKNHHVLLIDQLIGESDHSKIDLEFQHRKKRLQNFEGIQNRELPSGINAELRPYQKVGFQWLHFLHDYNFGGCLADDMGLGKTVETLVFLSSLKQLKTGHQPVLLVLPRSLLVNWQRETERFTPELSYYEYFGNHRTEDVKVFDDYDLIFTTYGVMLRDVDLLKQYRFHYVILDESQAIKNPLSKTAKAIRLLKANHRLALTGTPVENSTYELWSQFAFLNPGLLGSFEYFRREFVNPIERQGNMETAENLRKMVYPFILRRTKEQVTPELPPKTERIIYSDMEPSQRHFYEQTRNYYRAVLIGVVDDVGIERARMKVLEGLLRLRQICNHPKLVNKNFRGNSAKFALLMDTIENLQRTGHKALIFSQFVQMLRILRDEMDQRKIPYVYLDGRTRNRQQRVDTFQEDSGIPFFLISLKAGGTGLNLTAADYVIHIDPWWNPAVEMQATDRTHRIGQEKPVFIYKLIARESVEEKILLLQEKKRTLSDKLITTESGFLKSLSRDDIDVLFA